MEELRTEVRGDFNIHGTKNFQDAVFHQKSKNYDDRKPTFGFDSFFNWQTEKKNIVKQISEIF